MESTSSHVRVIVGVMLCSVLAPLQDVTGQWFRPPKFWSCPQNCSCFDGSGIQHWPLPGSTPARKDPTRSLWMEKNPRVECIGSGLTRIPVEEIMDDVEMLFMSSNNIPKISLADLKKFKNLKVLNLKRNKIRSIIADADTTLTNVTTLTLRFNEIAFLSKEHFQSFPNLKYLSIYHNHITTLPGDMFRFNPYLNRLYLGPNPIKSFCDDFLEELNLKRLTLRNMSLTAVPPSISRMSNLVFVDLSDNQISEVRNNSFSPCKSLIRVILENNFITSIEENAFNGATSLRTIQLSENRLTSLPGGILSNVSVERLDVELWENEFFCDCSLKDFKIWVDQRNAIDPTTDVRFRCSQPMRMRNKYSDDVTSDDFTCQRKNVIYKERKTIYTGEEMAIAVMLTFLCTLLCGIVAWRCTFKRKYGHLLRYASQRDDYGDMEELQ
ncbi:unnamed protein product [Clavelina lepadiformis]|uniref:LRRCT domain-containing protein n=1 Tax=Clavelina lepadiformis TaxID=159417 RepID=A0ABP0G2X4_CLALP